MTTQGHGTSLAIRVTPRASRDEITEVLDDGTIKVRLTAPPVDGKANEALVKFLSKVFELPKTDFEIVSGGASRNKRVRVFDLDNEAAMARVREHLLG